DERRLEPPVGTLFVRVHDQRRDERRRKQRRERRALRRHQRFAHPPAERLEFGILDGAHERARSASSSRSRRCTSCGTAWPPLFFITWPTRKPNGRSSPASTCAATAACSSSTARTNGRRTSAPLMAAPPVTKIEFGSA